ncbi:hypothetical protein D9M68_872960 [compost metagenome]
MWSEQPVRHEVTGLRYLAQQDGYTQYNQQAAFGHLPQAIICPGIAGLVVRLSNLFHKNSIYLFVLYFLKQK